MSVNYADMYCSSYVIAKKKFAQRLAPAEVYFSSCATTNDPKGTVELLRKMHVTMMQGFTNRGSTR
jgi:hypothetical protein